jgi:hypothetical protein
MGNRVHIEPTEFKNVRDGAVTFGVRIYDDYEQEYTNTWDSIPDDDLAVLALVLKENSGDMFDFVRENESGVYVGDNWLTWEEIKHLFEEGT